jgi:hypothetical protein
MMCLVLTTVRTVSASRRRLPSREMSEQQQTAANQADSFKISDSSDPSEPAPEVEIPEDKDFVNRSVQVKFKNRRKSVTGKIVFCGNIHKDDTPDKGKAGKYYGIRLDKAWGPSKKFSFAGRKCGLVIPVPKKLPKGGQKLLDWYKYSRGIRAVTVDLVEIEDKKQLQKSGNDENGRKDSAGNRRWGVRSKRNKRRWGVPSKRNPERRASTGGISRPVKKWHVIDKKNVGFRGRTLSWTNGVYKTITGRRSQDFRTENYRHIS